MTYFSCLDHFILYGTLFDETIMNASVLHDVDNLSDHDPIVLHLTINVMLLALSDRVYTPRLSWAKAGTGKLGNYASILSQTCKLHNHLLMHCYVQIGVVKILIIIVKSHIMQRR